MPPSQNSSTARQRAANDEKDVHTRGGKGSLAACIAAQVEIIAETRSETKMPTGARAHACLLVCVRAYACVCLCTVFVRNLLQTESSQMTQSTLW